QKSDHSGRQRGDGDGQEVVDLVLVGEDGGDVGTHGHERAVAERELPAVADQDVQAHDRDGEDQRLRPLAGEEARDHSRESDEEDDHHGDQPVARRRGSDSLHQTRRVAARPNRPLGLRIRTRMMMPRPKASCKSPALGMYAPARLMTTPTTRPPTTAPSGLSMPPRTAAANA